MKNKHIHPSAKSLALGLVAAAVLAASNSAQAALVFTLTEKGDGATIDVTVSGSIQFDPADAVTVNSSLGGNLYPGEPSIQIGPDIPSHLTLKIIQAGGPANFGTGGITLADDVGLGDTAGFSAPAGKVFLPSGYSSGSTINGSNVFKFDLSQTIPATFANLGITAGTYVWHTNSHGLTDTITLRAIPAVPEPSTFALLGLAGLGLLRRRR